MADGIHSDICSGRHDETSGACVAFREGDRVRYVMGLASNGGDITTAVHTISRVINDAKAVLVCDDKDGCYPMYGPESPVWVARLRLADEETIIGRQTREFMQAVAPNMAEPEARHILAHLAITLPPNDTRTEAEITDLLKGVIEVGNGYSEFEVEVTLVEEV